MSLSALESALGHALDFGTIYIGRVNATDVAVQNKPNGSTIYGRYPKDMWIAARTVPNGNDWYATPWKGKATVSGYMMGDYVSNRTSKTSTALCATGIANKMDDPFMNISGSETRTHHFSELYEKERPKPAKFNLKSTLKSSLHKSCKEVRYVIKFIISLMGNALVCRKELETMCMILKELYQKVFHEQFDFSDLDKRIKLQKAVYLLENMGLNIGDYSFSWAKYGPYSLRLDGDAQACMLRDLQQVDFSDFAINRFKKLSEYLQESYVPYNERKWIESIASIHFLQNACHLSTQNALDVLMKRKEYLNNVSLNQRAAKIADTINSLGIIN